MKIVVKKEVNHAAWYDSVQSTNKSYLQVVLEDLGTLWGQANLWGPVYKKKETMFKKQTN